MAAASVDGADRLVAAASAADSFASDQIVVAVRVRPVNDRETAVAASQGAKNKVFRLWVG
jgi:hypothetical protein